MIEYFNLGGNGFIIVAEGHKAGKTGPASCQVRSKMLIPE